MFSDTAVLTAIPVFIQAVLETLRSPLFDQHPHKTNHCFSFLHSKLILSMYKTRSKSERDISEPSAGKRPQHKSGSPSRAPEKINPSDVSCAIF
ncbi:hypothetical protein RRG08_032522 [Elysia crispata]|uniref:Uncharacterized protein n=1 Tax=Elysia crispata TaxID=231223 RepID=A0AAE1DNU4_9GAST|nr:hypothetical protein RRG08_032522 [Elysia crispata]